MKEKKNRSFLKLSRKKEKDERENGTKQSIGK